MYAHQRLEEMAVGKFPCLWTEFANRHGVVESVRDLRLVFRPHPRQHQVHIAGLDRFFRQHHYRSVHAVAMADRPHQQQPGVADPRRLRKETGNGIIQPEKLGQRFSGDIQNRGEHSRRRAGPQ